MGGPDTLDPSLVPDPTDAAADGLHHRYASVGSGETGNKIVARGMVTRMSRA